MEIALGYEDNQADVKKYLNLKKKGVKKDQEELFNHLEDIEKEKASFRKFGGSHLVKNEIKRAIDITNTGKTRRKDKKDYSTVEKVIDPKTERQLEKWIKNGVLTSVNGCISAGKEANVYHAGGGDEFPGDIALKIYKVTTMVFRDREEYIDGEFRFRKGHSKSNPRKLIKLWAEKEYRNLKRIINAGLPAPIPRKITDNILLMDFIGDDNGYAAPRLRDVKLNQEKTGDAYLQIVKMLRTLYWDCNLVHADFSEYNLLYWQEKVYIIDVSQSVELDHPFSKEFLKRDIFNINDYFKKKGVHIFRIRDLYEFIIAEEVQIEEEIERMKEVSLEGDEDEDTIKDFMSENSGLGLLDASDYIIITHLSQLKKDYDAILGNDHQENSNSEMEEDDEEEEDEQEEGVDLSAIIGVGSGFGDFELANTIENFYSIYKEDGRKKNIDPFAGMSKKERKLKVKLEKREKRLTKMPKSKKKRLMNKGKPKKKR